MAYIPNITIVLTDMKANYSEDVSNVFSLKKIIIYPEFK